MQGFEGGTNLPQAAELQRQRRRRLLDRSQNEGYTPGSSFDMSVLQQRSDATAPCTQRCCR
jgi:hypothetical protein